MKKPLGLRKATLDDLDDITEVALAAFPDNPQWDYRFPYRKQYPEDTKKWTRQQYQDNFETRQGFTIIVAGEIFDDEDKTVGKPVAFAVWDVQNVDKVESEKKSIAGPPNDGRGTRKDANPEHMEAIGRAIGEGYKKYFERWSSIEIQLRILATHPDHQKRGAGALLCRWGMDIAKAHGSPVTLFGSLVAKALYSRLGFNQIGPVIAQVEGEEERITMYAMVYNEPKGNNADDDN